MVLSWGAAILSLVGIRFSRTGRNRKESGKEAGAWSIYQEQLTSWVEEQVRGISGGVRTLQSQTSTSRSETPATKEKQRSLPSARSPSPSLRWLRRCRACCAPFLTKRTQQPFQTTPVRSRCTALVDTPDNTAQLLIIRNAPGFWIELLSPK